MKSGSLVMLALLACVGCRTNFFSARGEVGSDGTAFGTWASAPEGCSRAPSDRLPVGQSGTIASFLWQDPADNDPMRRDHKTDFVAPAPIGFDLMREGDETVVWLETTGTRGWLLHRRDCSRWEIETHEEGPSFAGGRSALGGTVRLECRVKGSRVWADFRFSHCEY